jgi:hypothetical protein
VRLFLTDTGAFQLQQAITRRRGDRSAYQHEGTHAGLCGCIVVPAHAASSIGEPHQPLPIHPPRGPPDWIDADEQLLLDEDLDQDRYEIEFDQRLTW